MEWGGAVYQEQFRVLTAFREERCWCLVVEDRRHDLGVLYTRNPSSEGHVSQLGVLNTQKMLYYEAGRKIFIAN